MKELLGQDVLSISAPQDRSELTMRVIDETGKISDIRFANDDGTGINVDFSHISLNVINDHEGNLASLGELEEVNRIDNGFEIVGDFGIIWLECKTCTPAL
ncbi:hypothetical protein EZI54_23970 [Marinobacter halodurans]|uniref:Uncharacterized protein n=1 Tax=Marinobacter halodurans TaxID=2528979 RepID=A0ABY1ZD08_9GAMM|nr:hypothetical protein EZI54_23970 [Marinobacter halodurans]